MKKIWSEKFTIIKILNEPEVELAILKAEQS